MGSSRWAHGAGSISSRKPQRSRTAPWSRPVLIERKQRFGVGFKPSAKFRVLATLQVTAHCPVITEGMTDPARSLNEQGCGDGQCAAAAVELPSLLWRAQFGEPAIAWIDIQRPEQWSHADGTDDLVMREPMSDLRDLVSDQHRNRSFGDVDEHQRFGPPDWTRVNDHTSQARKLLAVRESLAFEPLLIRLDDGRIGARRGPLTQDGNALAHRVARRANRRMCPIELPTAVISHANRGTVVPGTERSPPSADSPGFGPEQTRAHRRETWPRHVHLALPWRSVVPTRSWECRRATPRPVPEQSEAGQMFAAVLKRVAPREAEQREPAEGQAETPTGRLHRRADRVSNARRRGRSEVVRACTA